MPVGAVEIPGLEIEAELGHGTYSVVYRARRGARTCAVKVARRGGRLSRWFRREAVALARVDHPGVPDVLDVGEIEGRPYLVMELVEGQTLAQRLWRGSLSQPETLELGLALAGIIEAVHATGLVHRDIKPRNIVLSASGEVRLVDFGLVAQLRPVMTVADGAGTHEYAAPEQLRLPTLVDARSDLYALGRVLSECVGNDLDADLTRVLDPLLSVDPGQRYPSAAALAFDLRRMLAGESPLGPDRSPEVAPEVEPVGLVGREHELHVLRETWDDAVRGRGSLLLLEGRPGSGKSRLLREFVKTLGGDVEAWVLEAGIRSAPLHVVRQLIERHLDRIDALPEPIRSTRQAAVRAFAEGPTAAVLAPMSDRLARLLGNPAPTASDQEAFLEAASELLLHLARDSGPVLICVDDMQWLDPVSREILVRVALSIGDVPLLLLGTMHSGGWQTPALRRFARTLGPNRLDVLELEKLDALHVEKLVAGFLGTDTLQPELLRRIVGLSDGTPLDVLEVVGALVDGGALWPHWGRWRFDAQIAEDIQLSRGTAALLARRLERLPPATVRTLQVAAMMGPRFDERAVAAIVGIRPDDVSIALAEAGRAGLIELDRWAQPCFVHGLVREAVLEALSPADERSLHQAIAESLDRGEDTEPETLLAIADHYGRGEPDRNPVRAHRVARAAARAAVENWDHETALRFFALARALAEAAGVPLDLEFHRAEAESHNAIGALDEGLQALQKALRLARDDAQRADTLGRIAWVHQMKGQPRQAWDVLARAFRILGDRLPTSRPQSLAQAAFRTMRSKLNAHTTPRIDETGRRYAQVLCDLHGQNVRLGVEYDRLLAAGQSALAILQLGEQLGPSATLARAYATYGGFMAIMGRRRAGERYLSRGQAIARDLPDPAALVHGAMLRSTVACWTGDLDQALSISRSCLDRYAHWLEVSEYCLVIGNTRIIESVRGRPKHALDWLERGVKRVRRHGKVPAVFSQMVAPAVRAALAALGRESEAGRYLDDDCPVQQKEVSEGLYKLAAWGPLALHLAESKHEQGQLEALIREFERHDYDPRRIHLCVAEYYIVVAHARCEQCLQASDEERQLCLERFDRALSDLRKSARIPLFKAHLYALQGYRALLHGKHDRARQRFSRAEALGERETAPWVLYAVARGEAHLLRREGKQDAAQDQARIAEALAHRHGSVLRLQRIREEFSLHARSISHRQHLDEHGSSGASTTSSSGGRQLRTLLKVVHATAADRRLEPQARAVLDEVVRAVGARRGLLLFQHAHTKQAELIVGRTGEREDWRPSDPDFAALLKHVRATGKPLGWPEQAGEEPRVPVDVRRALAVPLHVHETIVGALYLERDVGEPPFARSEDELLATLSPQVPVALELSSLLEERDRLQETLRQAQKMEAIGQLASGIAHDFNNMLAAIHNATECIDQELSETSKQAIDIIRDASHRASELTRQLLAFSRRQVLELEAIDVSEVVSGLLPLIRRLMGPGIELELRGGDAPLCARTDRSSLEQALVNLSVNARDAMPGGGTIVIELGQTERVLSATDEGPARECRHVTVRVSDTGAGMSPAVLDKVFEPFFTTKQAGVGTGLGLASVHGFIKQTGGHIEVESKEGIGSTFTVYLPATDELPEDGHRSDHEELRARERAPVVLLVDDEPLVRKAVARGLSAEGYIVKIAEDAPSALSLIASGLQVDLLITDVLMPTMNGTELVRRLRAAGVRVPAIFISGYTGGELIQQGLLQQDVDFLQKPFVFDRLSERVSALLGRNRRT